MTYRRKEIIGPHTLYLGDCREILADLSAVNAAIDAVVTDPPYGIGEARSGNASRGKLATSRDYGHSTWDDETQDDAVALAVSMARHSIVFGGNYYDLPPTSCWLVWDKLNGNTDFADCELAWTNLPKAVRRIRFMWHGMLRANNEPRGDHPTQKPVEVMRWCIGHLPPDVVTILDPFCGSGTTLVAAAKLGKHGIGIEIKEDYFDIACRRVEEAMKQGDLFVQTPAPKPVQEVLL